MYGCTFGLFHLDIIDLRLGTVEDVNVPQQFILDPSGSTSKSIEIWATEGVVAYGMNQQSFSNDAFLALPVDALGKTNSKTFTGRCTCTFSCILILERVFVY